jgi:hypothetical protein
MNASKMAAPPQVALLRFLALLALHLSFLSPTAPFPTVNGGNDRIS